MARGRYLTDRSSFQAGLRDPACRRRTAARGPVPSPAWPVPRTTTTTDVRIDKLVVGPYENNVFVVRCTRNRARRCSSTRPTSTICCSKWPRATGVRRVLTTHGHFDHIQAVTQMRDAGIDVGVAAEDARCSRPTTSRSPTTT